MTDPRIEAAAKALDSYDYASAGNENGGRLFASIALAAADEVMFSEEAIERVAEVLHILDHGPWVSGGGITPYGTPWGTSREASRREEYRIKARAVVEALKGDT